MKAIIYILLFSSITLLSCSKETDDDGQCPPSVADYTPMSIGNYWIYELVEVDTLGNETKRSRIDTVTLTGIKIINSNTYFVYEGTYVLKSSIDTVLWVLRDSLGYLVDTNGFIHFADNDYSDSLESSCIVENSVDTLFCSVSRLLSPLSEITVPAGSFLAKDFQQLITTFGNLGSPNIPNPRAKNIYYADGVGRIMETFFYSKQPGHFEIRLIKYQVE